MANASQPPRERESKIQRSIIIRLNRLGIRLWRRNVGAMKKTDQNGKIRFIRFAQPGQADLWGLDFPEDLPWARHWEIETKREGEHPTPLQLAWLKLRHDEGCVAFWADNARIAERIAEAILVGGRIVWLNSGDEFDVELSSAPIRRLASPGEIADPGMSPEPVK